MYNMDIEKYFIAWMAFCAVTAVSVIGFLGWLLIKILGHFGII